MPKEKHRFGGETQIWSKIKEGFFAAPFSCLAKKKLEVSFGTFPLTGIVSTEVRNEMKVSYKYEEFLLFLLLMRVMVGRSVLDIITKIEVSLPGIQGGGYVDDNNNKENGLEMNPVTSDEDKDEVDEPSGLHGSVPGGGGEKEHAHAHVDEPPGGGEEEHAHAHVDEPPGGGEEENEEWRYGGGKMRNGDMEWKKIISGPP